MRLVRQNSIGAGPGAEPRLVGYSLWLSARDTDVWARRPGKSWPGSVLAGRRVFVEVDSNGIADVAVDGKGIGGGGDCPADELGALVGDFLPADLRHLWPTWAK